MKKLIAAVLVALTLSGVQAKPSEQVSVVEDQITTVTVPFGIKSYTPSNREVVRIEETSGTSLRITALKRGRCDLEVRGEKDLVQKYEITVFGSVNTVLEMLTTELDQVPEARARIVGETIRVDGEVSSIRKWEYLQKVLESYSGVVRNFVVFNPGPDLILKIKETLQLAGFTATFEPLKGERENWKADTVSLLMNRQTRILDVKARVFTPEKRDRILQCLKSERWLTLQLDASEADKEDRDKVRALVDIYVAKPVIRLSVAYAVLGQEDIQNLGNRESSSQNGGGLTIGSTFNMISRLIGVQGRNRSTAESDIGLSSITRFFAEKNISRVSDTAYTTMESWDKEGARFKSGGTVYVRNMGNIKGNGNDTTIVGTVEMKEIPYGFQVVTHGGLVKDDLASLDLDIEISSVQAYGNEGDVDRKEEKSKQHITCHLGKTTFLSGFAQLVDKNMPASGLPVLRNTPLLKWFISDSGKEVTDRRLIVMVCPEIVDNTQEGTLNSDAVINVPTVRDAGRGVDGGKTTDEMLDDRKKFHGFWYWLNWFTF